MKQRILITSFLLVLTIGLVACDGAGSAPTATPELSPVPSATPEPPASPTPAPTSTPEPQMVTLTDDIGNTVEIEGSVERIVSLAPSNTEIAFALGLGDRVVGVTEFCDHPPEALEIAKIGDMEPNLEQIVALDPDLVLGIGGEPVSPAIGQLQGLGLTVLVLEPTDLESMYHDIDLMGQATGVEEQAAELVADMRARVEAITSVTADVADRPVVFYELDATDPGRPWTVGPNSWHDEFIQMAGGVNLAGTQESAWVQLSAEEIVAQDPEVIILGDAAWGVSPESVAERPGWEVISAVQNGRVYPIDDNLVSRPGPRVVEGIEELARLIHPELFE
jgi:iron complex transport system substrate-binding protein